MERTMSFSDWVNEYKPVEFNVLDTERAVRYNLETWDKHLDAANLIGKYLIRESECFGKFPDNHIWTPRQLGKRTPAPPPRHYIGPLPFWGYMIVTRKPRIDRRDKIIIDLSAGEYNYKIVLVDNLIAREIDFYED